jgi:hypothetical protein
MKIINSIFLGFVSLLFLSQTAEAHLDVPLKWKIQSWQFVVLVQAGERMTNNDKIYVEKKMVKILRGKKEDLPKFENWQFNDLEEGHYYLLNYWNYPVQFQSAGWDNERFNVEKTNDTFVIKAIQDNQTHGFYDMDAIYSDLPLQDFEKLLGEVPFEPNPTNTFFYKTGHK